MSRNTFQHNVRRDSKKSLNFTTQVLLFTYNLDKNLKVNTYNVQNIQSVLLSISNARNLDKEIRNSEFYPNFITNGITWLNKSIIRRENCRCFSSSGRFKFRNRGKTRESFDCGQIRAGR